MSHSRSRSQSNSRRRSREKPKTTQEVIEEDNKFYCMQGRHRICMLLKIFGKNLNITIKNKKLTEFIIKQEE